MAHTVDVSTWIISCKCKLMAKKGRNHLLLSFSCFTLLIAQSYSQIEGLLQDQLKDGNELFSASGKFKLGFFSPSKSTERYLGLRYNIPRERDFFYKPEYGRSSADVIVWVANRDDPILDRSGSLKIDSTDGNLKIFQSRGSPVAVSRVKGARNTSAFLLKNGNFVLREMNLNGSVKQVVWQSFDYPTDTLLPGMKLGINLQTEQPWSLQSWWTDNSPAPGSFTLGMDPNVSDRLIIWWRGQVFCSLVWQSGHFNFSYSYLNGIKSYDFRYTSNEQEKYFSYSLIDDATSFPMLQLKNDGNFYDDSGFPVSLNFWDEKGPLCRRDLQSFEDKLGFMSGEGSKLEGSDNMTFFDCAVKCIYDCSCVAISVRDKYVNTGCEIWSREAKFTESNKGDPLTVYFLVYTEKKWWIWLIIAVELGILKFCLCYLTWKKYKAKEKKWWIWLIVAVVLVILMFCLCYLTWRKYKANEENWWLPLTVAVGAVLLAPLFFYLCCMMWRKLKANVEHKIHRKNQKKLLRELDDILLPHNMHGKGKGEGNDQSISNELKIFDFRAIVASTNNFATTNKLGEGGFGPVYKGRLLDDREIAIKRLSKRSGQGIVEFKNEVKLIAKLQHTNLVRLLGCALQGEERILVYEYMPNKSLDFFIFDSSRKNLLNWKKRFNIIEGIAQGLVYIHKYLRLRVIHRDLKASNILLDDQMNPKISDFGMARIF